MSLRQIDRIHKLTIDLRNNWQVNLIHLKYNKNYLQD